MSQIECLLTEQARYYRERAGEYEDWWYRRGRYDRGTDVLKGVLYLGYLGEPSRVYRHPTD
jgi:hypothetical protein